MRLFAILVLTHYLLLGCGEDPNKKIELFFDKIIEQVPEISLLEEYKDMPLEKAMHSGHPQIFGQPFSSLEDNKVYRKYLLDYYNENNLDTMNYNSYCFFRAHFHQYLNNIEVDMDELSVFVSQHLYNY